MFYVEECKHEPEYVMAIDEVNYHGASQKGAPEFLGDLMINFTSISDIPSAAKIPQLAEHLSIGFEEEIMVSWPDFGTPLVKLTFWEALHNYIRENKWETVCFHCEAGHGRTGTALSCMLIAIQGYTPEEAVWHVRTHYCTEAIETYDQVEYLSQIDKYYNEREQKEEDLPIPSMVFQMQRREAAKQEEAEKKKNAQEDKYEGFKGVTPR